MKITKQQLKQIIKEELLSEDLSLTGDKYELISPEGLLKGRVSPDDIIKVNVGGYMDFKEYRIQDLLDAVRSNQ
mgnify:CR=1 FL=1|tara:strand:+ start:27964 stop:28185 length:222 start_codon:yes stop_codon:yes gene_type:complete